MERKKVLHMASIAFSSGSRLVPLSYGTTVHLDMFWNAMLYSECPLRTDPGRKETLAFTRREASHWHPKGDIMQPMKKPIRLMGMVFQID